MRPHPDDFRIERQDVALVVTFTPTGQAFRFDINGGRDRPEPHQVAPPRAGAQDYPEEEVLAMAVELARGAFSSESRLPG